jgi:hypothetical protein
VTIIQELISSSRRLKTPLTTNIHKNHETNNQLTINKVPIHKIFANIKFYIWMNGCVHGCTTRNWPKCNHYICDYIRLLVICNYIWTFLQLFLVLVIFATTMQLVCNYFDVHPSMWTTFSLIFIQEEQFMSH